MSIENGNIDAPKPVVEEKRDLAESVESIPNQKTLERITSLRNVYRGLNEALNFQVYHLRDRLAVHFTPGNEEQGLADAVSLLTEEQCGRMNEQLALFAFDFFDKQNNEHRNGDAFDERAHAETIAAIFKELPSRNENAVKASVGLDLHE